MLAGPRPSSISGLQTRDDGDDQRGQERFSQNWRQTDTPTARNDEDDGCRVKAGQSSRTQHLGFSICFGPPAALPFPNRAADITGEAR